MYLQTIYGKSILNAFDDGEFDILIHQCNCVTKKSKGIANQIFEKWPIANTYKKSKPRIPGTFDSHLINKQKICNIYGMFFPGPAGIAPYYGYKLRTFNRNSVNNDTNKGRMEWTHQAIESMIKANPNCSIGMPYKMGCNLGGLDWDEFKQMLEKIAEKYKNTNSFTIYNIKEKPKIINFKNSDIRKFFI